MSDKMPDAWIVPSASGDGYLCTLSYVNLPGWNRYVPAARIAELEAELAAERERREADETDAARYRWLREWRARWEIRYWNGIYWNQLTTDELGAAIDAAIAAGRSED